MKKIFILLIILGCMMFQMYPDTTTVDIEAAIELAIRHNLSLQVSEINYQTARRRLNTTWNNFVPSLTLGSTLVKSDQFISGSQTGDLSWNSGFSVQASLTLNPGISNTIHEIQIAYQTAQINYDWAKNELSRSIKKLFNYLLVLKENIRLKAENIELARKRYVKLQSNFNNGLASQLEMLSAEVNYENQKPAYTQAKLDYHTQLLNFKKLIGIESNDQLELSGTLFITKYSFDRDQLVRAYVGQIPDLQLKQNEIRQLKLNKDLVFGNNCLPSLSLSGLWDITVPDSFSSTGWETENWTDNFTIAVSLSFPVDGFLPGSKKDVAIREATDAVKKAELEYRELSAKIFNSLDLLIMQIETYAEQITLLKLNLDLAQEKYVMTEASYKNGTSELLDLENAEQEVLVTNQDLLIAQYQYLAGLIDLESFFNKSIADITKEYEL